MPDLCAFAGLALPKRPDLLGQARLDGESVQRCDVPVVTHPVDLLPDFFLDFVGVDNY